MDKWILEGRMLEEQRVCVIENYILYQVYCTYVMCNKIQSKNTSTNV